MKKSLIFLLMLAVNLCMAQSPIYQKISETVARDHQEVSIEEKLIVVNFDKASGPQNDKLYSELQRTSGMYGSAKLKGGKKGIVCITVIGGAEEEIALNKAGYDKLLKITISELNELDSQGIKNIVFDSNGEILFKNLDPKEIYESIHKLIIR